MLFGFFRLVLSRCGDTSWDFLDYFGLVVCFLRDNKMPREGENAD